MSDKSKNSTASTPDQLVNSGLSTIVELSEQELDRVSAGTTNAIKFNEFKDHGSLEIGYQKG